MASNLNIFPKISFHLKKNFQQNKHEGVLLVHANFMVGSTLKYNSLKATGNWHLSHRLDNMLPECATIPDIDDPVSMYKADVKSLIDKKLLVCKNSPSAAFDTTIALSCLQRTTPSLQLKYPKDADLHLNEI